LSILRKLAKEWNKRFEEDAKKAGRELVRYIKKHEEIIDAALDEIVVKAVKAEIQQDIGHERKRRWDSIRPKVKNDEVWVPPKANGGKAETKETTPSTLVQKRYVDPEVLWMDYPVVNNKKFCHCYKGEIEEERDKHYKLREAHSDRGDFFGEVAERMPDYVTQLGDCLTEGIVRRIAEKRQNIFIEPPKQVGESVSSSAAL
jgi:hypothetical protein